MVRKIDVLKIAAEAHSNLNTWGAVIALLEGGLLYGDTSQHRAATRVINTAKREQQKFLRQYDVACVLANAPCQHKSYHSTGVNSAYACDDCGAQL